MAQEPHLLPGVTRALLLHAGQRGEHRVELFRVVKKAFTRSALLSASISATRAQSEHTLPTGLGAAC